MFAMLAGRPPFQGKQVTDVIESQRREPPPRIAALVADVPPALEQWTSSGLDVRIYSSGSIEAQRLFFGHTAAGDLTPHLRGHYDTTTGPKRERESYARIAADMGLEPRAILFVSDVGAELDAARAAGMASVRAAIEIPNTAMRGNCIFISIALQVRTPWDPACFLIPKRGLMTTQGKSTRLSLE